jgi:hypothetical protein
LTAAPGRSVYDYCTIFSSRWLLSGRQASGEDLLPTA